MVQDLILVVHHVLIIHKNEKVVIRDLILAVLHLIYKLGTYIMPCLGRLGLGLDSVCLGLDSVCLGLEDFFLPRPGPRLERPRLGLASASKKILASASASKIAASASASHTSNF